MSEEFKDDYNLEALTRVQPAGDDFDLEVTPRYVTAYTQGYEALTSRVVKAQLAAADLFIDVGAHYGYYTLLGALAHPRLRVVAVEPVPENHAILRRNLARHGLGADRVTPVQAAVSAATGTAELFKSEASDNSSLYPHPASGTLGRIAVPTVALDELVAAHPAERIFVKLDTDGHELEVLRGFARTLADHPAVTLALEINPKMFRIAGSSTEELLARLAEHGFKAYAMDDRASRFYPLDQPANLARLEALYAQSFYNVLCVRAERALSAVFFAHSAQAAGAERSLADAVGGLARRGVLCTVVLPGDGPLAPQLAQAGAALFRAPINGALANGWNWAGRGAARAWRADLAETRDYFALEVTPELQQLAPDVIFTQTMVCPWGAFCAERLGVPHALSVREYGELDQQLAFYAGGLNASADALYASSAAVFCINREIKDLLFGADPDRKTEVVYSGIQAEPIRAAAGRDAASPALGAAPRIGLFATLAPGKGQMDLVRACARLAGQGRAFTCHLAGRVGDAAYAAALREAVAESGCADRFVWLGALENPYPALRAMDLLVSCSVREALGRSLIEAMLLDVPVIYADSGGPREVYTANEHGLAYPPGDVDALCAAITEVLDQPAAAARRAVKARDHARQVFDPETFGDRLEQRLRQCARTVRTEGMPVTRLLGAENATHAAPPFQPAFFYAPADEGFAPERMVSGVPSTFGPFAQSVTLPGAGFPRVRFDPLEAPAAHLRLFRIELETADGVRLSSTDFTCHANGIARDEAWAWDFPTPDPQVVFTAQQPVKCIRIWGELRELSCRRLTALAEDLRVRGAAPPAAPESRPPRWLRLLAAAQGVRRRWSPALPPDFDADLYLRLNRDVAAAGCDPAAHYLANGRAEGRPYRLLPQFAADLPASRPAILVVSHEASRSGAPIIALNLVQALSAQYEVYVLLLNGGPLAPAFRQAAVQVVQVPTDAPPEWRAPYLIAQLCARRTFAFAVVNSVASHEVLAPLADQDIPTVTLIHEFASDAFDPECFRQAFLGSTELVFPAALVRADALARHPEAESARWHVAPQGRCVAPAAPDPARRAPAGAA
ncbi:MAG: FkbM family methyltransferase, partial [Candidatus Marinimicrobia bacterium]|nr:FkbM family methyltransferase [Candidatus Neomarinimicrobiota bacterium]